MTEIFEDFRHTIRGLLRSPAYTITCLLTMTIGIGATITILSVVYSVLFKPLPFAEPDRLVAIAREGSTRLSGQIFLQIREHARSFEHVVGQSGRLGWNVIAGQEAEYLEGFRISRGYFAALGIRPALGREFTEQEDQPGGPSAVILSGELWRRRFQERADVIGTTVLLGGVPHTVVGVMPAGIQTFPAADLWTPLRVSPADNSWNYDVFARLRGGVTVAQATSEIQSLRASLVVTGPNRDTQPPALIVTPYQTALVGDKSRALYVLLAAVTLLLVIACANVAALQLVRGTARLRELAVRIALGGRRRVVQLLLVEAAVHAVLAASFGLAAALWAIRIAPTFVPEELLAQTRVSVEWPVVLASVGLAVVTVVLCALVPALDLAQTGIHTALQSGAARHTASAHTVRRLRVIASGEMALTAVLLVAAGLLIKTYTNMRRAELGFDPRNVLVASMSLRGSLDGMEPLAFFDRALARLREVPGVESAAVASSIPVDRGLNLPIESPPERASREVISVDWVYVSPDYFETLRIPLLRGRRFTPHDRSAGAPVAIVNEAFAREYFGGPAALGRQIRLVKGLQGDPPREIVGIVGNVKSASSAAQSDAPNALAAAAPPTIYVPVAQVPPGLMNLAHNFVHVHWIVRGRGMDAETQAAVRATLAREQPLLPVIGLRSMAEVVAEAIATERFHAVIVAAFAIVAMILAGVGLYALFAYSVKQRTQEIGIRMALGARPADIVAQFGREALSISVIAIGAGFGLALALSRVLQSVIWGVEALDPGTYITAAGLLVLCGIAVTLASAGRAAFIDPADALRSE